MVSVVVLACVLRVTTKNVVDFLKEKSAPPATKSWLLLRGDIVSLDDISEKVGKTVVTFKMK